MQARHKLGDTNRIISECLDEALSSVGFVDKSIFNQLLRQHDISEDSLGEKFESVHEALKNFYGNNHIQIDRLIVKILHQRAKIGEYSQSDEVSAFGRIIEVFLKETEETLEKHRRQGKPSVYIRKLEKEVREARIKARDAERLAIIGQTAGMVGHDIRNPLQAITGDLYLIKEEALNMPESKYKESIVESLSSIEENIAYINKIVTDLQDYTKPLAPKMEEVELQKVLNTCIAAVKIPSGIKVNEEIAGDLKLQTDALYLRRLLTNLISNAVQAMPNGGLLTIRAGIDAKVRIQVEDTGVGIPDAVKSKVFSPLFTTKAKGQGLGLAVVKRLVEGLGGIISFESQIDKGTRFTVELPIRTNRRQTDKRFLRQDLRQRHVS